MRTVARLAAVAVLALPGAMGSAAAQDALYDDRLLRLSEILGSVHFLRNLCGERTDEWRNDMQKLLEAENPEPERRARMIASFNRGYRGFASTYVTCTEAATESIERYMEEGERLAREVVVRFGN
jgi:uncharacterized protein (TIGR02301 family)